MKTFKIFILLVLMYACKPLTCPTCPKDLSMQVDSLLIINSETQNNLTNCTKAYSTLEHNISKEINGYLHLIDSFMLIKPTIHIDTVFKHDSIFVLTTITKTDTINILRVDTIIKLEKIYISKIDTVYKTDTIIKIKTDTIKIKCDSTPAPPVINPNKNVVIVWSENFDNATSTQPWINFAQGWFSNQNELETIDGKGKVLRVNFAAGTVGSGSGLGNYLIPLDSAYTELYLSWEYFVQSGFAGGGGKFFAGFLGGTIPNIPKIFGDDTDGWASMFLFQKDAPTYSTYNYFKGTEYEPGTGWPYGYIMTNIAQGQWRNITMRLKINDTDKSNGILEVFDNKKLIYQQLDAKIINNIHPEYLIQHIYLNNFFGGTGSQYASPKDQYMRFDNLVAFYYPKGSEGYRSGASEKGRVLSIPVTSSYHPTSPNQFTQYNYTESSGIIKSHCGFEIAVRHPDGFQTSTIQVAGATMLSLNVTKFQFEAGMSYTGYKQILKIYSGTGTGKVLQKTFIYDTYTIVPTTINIYGNSATIEWQAGSGCIGGFTISYNSNGTGSGKNFICKNCIAKQ